MEPTGLFSAYAVHKHGSIAKGGHGLPNKSLGPAMDRGGLTTPGAPRPNFLWGPYTGGRNGVSKGIEYGHRPPTLRADHPLNARKAVSGVAQPESVEV
jgi:hypothetical protein